MYNEKNATYIKSFGRQYYASKEKYKELSRLADIYEFDAPKIVVEDDQNKILQFDYIPDLQSSRQAYFKAMTYGGDEDMQLFVRIGEVLAQLHSGVRLNYKESWAPCYDFDDNMKKIIGDDYQRRLEETPNACLHCDYGFSNVNYIVDNNSLKLVIIDPCPNNYVTFHARSFGSVYIDLASFISCMDGLIPLVKYPVINWKKLVRIKDAFVSGYEAYSKITIDRQLLSAMAHTTTYCYFTNRYGYGIKSWLARGLVYNRIKSNIPRLYNS